MVRWLRILLAWILLAAAVWFTALQLFVMHRFAPIAWRCTESGVAWLGVFVSVSEVELWVERCGDFVAQLALLVASSGTDPAFWPRPETHRSIDATAAPF